MVNYAENHAVSKADLAAAEGAPRRSACKTGVRGKGKYKTWAVSMLLRASLLAMKPSPAASASQLPYMHRELTRD